MAAPSESVRLDMKDLSRRLKRDPSTIHKWYLAGRFPRPHYISAGRRAWWLHEVEAWEREQMALPPPRPAGAKNLGRDASDAA